MKVQRCELVRFVLQQHFSCQKLHINSIYFTVLIKEVLHFFKTSPALFTQSEGAPKNPRGASDHSFTRSLQDQGFLDKQHLLKALSQMFATSEFHYRVVKINLLYLLKKTGASGYGYLNFTPSVLSFTLYAFLLSDNKQVLPK